MFGREQQRIDIQLSAPIAQDGTRAASHACVDDPADYVGALVAKEQAAQDLDCRSGSALNGRDSAPCAMSGSSCAATAARITRRMSRRCRSRTGKAEIDHDLAQPARSPVFWPPRAG